jgi:mannose-1-phosphate guanylyltransferase/phosphomannomutase
VSARRLELGLLGALAAFSLVPLVLMLRHASAHGVVFAGAEGGGYIFPEFLAAYDGVMSVVKLLELLARNRTTLAAVADEIPEVNVVRKDVALPWEAKGTVMRRLLERTEEGAIIIDGVKTYRGKDWALVVPHPEEPLIRVWAEAGSNQEAESLAEEFAAVVEDLKG